MNGHGVTVAVTGATGRLGSRVVARLLGAHRPVIALARRPAVIPPRRDLLARFADYDDPPSLSAALTGVDTLVFISSDGVAESMGRHHEHVVAAAIQAGVRRVVYTSIIDDRPDSRFYYAAVHRATEARLAASGRQRLIARTTSVRQGRFAAVSPDVATLTGHPASSFASFLSRWGGEHRGPG